MTGAPRFWILLVAALAAAAFPRAIRAQEDHPIELLHADQVSLERADLGDAYHARGHVHFRQGTAELWADRSIWFEQSGEVHLYGNVRVRDTAEALDADTVIYLGESDRAFAYGHVEYARPGGDMKAFADRGEYDRRKHEARLYHNARMVHRDDDSTGRIETQADTLLLFAEADSGVAIGHVRIQRQDGHATAERAVFSSEAAADRLFLFGQPQGTFEENDVSGDTLEMEIIHDELRRLWARGNARVTYREYSSLLDVTSESDISADRMTLHFSEGELRHLTATDQARSHYVPSWGRPGERNDASGDTVRIDLSERVVRRVQVIGGAQGIYYSPRGIDGEQLDTINYQSDYIDYHVDKSWIRLWDRATINFGGVLLSAGQIIYQTDVAVLRAYALDDTLLTPPADYYGSGAEPTDRPDSATTTDSTSREAAYAAIGARMAVRRPPSERQRPVLHDGAQEVEGERLVYDIPTQRGRIVQSRTETQDGYYHGGNFRKESEGTYFVQDGKYTTCELDDPHFYFTGKKMKVRDGDRVITRPGLLKIEDLPVLWIPYYVFSIKKDRHSGMLPIRFGNFERGSRYVRNIGYYFAVNDYWDIAPALDIVEGEGILWHMRTTYAWRYRLSGAVFGSYNKHTRTTQSGEETTTRWNLLFSHNQIVSPTLTVAGSGNFVSDNSFYQDFTADQHFRLNRSLRSQINLNKRWTTSSLILALDDTRNLDTDSRQSLLPRYALAIPQRQILQPRKLKGGVQEPRRWYHEFRAGFNSIGQHFISDAGDGSTLADRHYLTTDHTATLNYLSRMLGGNVTLTPAIRLQETWYYVFQPKDDTLPTGVVAETFYRRLAGSFSISSQTNLFGLYPLKAGALRAFRHVFTPSLSFSMTPPVTQNDPVRDYTGVGGGSSTRNRVLGIGIGNLFQMKTESGDQEKHWDLLNVNISTAYNFELERERWADISTSIRSGVVRNPDINIVLRHDPYDPVTGELDLTPRLASVSTTIGFRLSGRGSSRPAGVGSIAGTLGGADFEVPGGTQGGFGQTQRGRSWDFQAQYQFTESRTPDVSDPSQIIKRINHWVRPSFRFNPTPNWDVQTDLYYDIRNLTMNDWTLRVHRDLHCWEAEFSWVITGPRAGYYFKINVKRLSDLKFERSESGIRDALFGAIPGL